MSGWFDGVVGHARVISLLTTELEEPANAYLFVGAAGVGKATVARHFATGLLCPTREPGCNVCRRVMEGNHADFIPVVPEGSANLGVDQARMVVAQAAMAPVEGERKVFLFEEAGVMTDQAANAILKTLEEPTPTTVFILVAEAEDDLPATIASRCRTVHFGRVPEDELVARLAQQGVEQEQASELARIAGGRPGLALSLSRSPQAAEFRRLWLSIPTRVTPRPGDAQRLAEEVLEALAPMVTEAAGGEEDKERRARAERRAELALLTSGSRSWRRGTRTRRRCSTAARSATRTSRWRTSPRCRRPRRSPTPKPSSTPWWISSSTCGASSCWRTCSPGSPEAGHSNDRLSFSSRSSHRAPTRATQEVTSSRASGRTRYWTSRPWRTRSTRPASSSSARCLAIAWRVMGSSAASFEADAGPRSDSRSNTRRRVGSASAANRGWGSLTPPGREKPEGTP